MQRLRAAGVLTPDDSSLIVYDLAVQRRRRTAIRDALPGHWSHHLAIKTNPIAAVLRPAVGDGFGLEAASWPEVLHAHRIGAASIVWNSPVKTAREVASLDAASTTVVLDSLGELPLLTHVPPGASAGLRVNPQIGRIGPPDMSCATEDSKFGEPISRRNEIIDAFAREPRLRLLHVHSGSLPDELDLLVVGVRAVLDLAADVDDARVRLGGQPLEAIDIGGGLPPDVDCSLVRRYAALLRRSCPELFDGGRRVLTEFGRYYHAGAGVTLSRIAQVKAHAQGQTILHHVGADVFVRESYQAAPQHELDVLDGAGDRRTTSTVSTNVAGPLCFAGDHLAIGASLPKAQMGDWLHIGDTGANTLALWSHHCSRSRPAVITWDSDDPSVAPRIVLPRQEPEDAIAIWDAPATRT